MVYGFLYFKEIAYLCNNLIIVGKFHIRKCIFLKIAPNFITIENDLMLFFKVFKEMNSNNTEKLHAKLKLFFPGV